MDPKKRLYSDQELAIFRESLREALGIRKPTILGGSPVPAVDEQGNIADVPQEPTPAYIQPMAIDRRQTEAEAKRLEGEGRIDEAIEMLQKLSEEDPWSRALKNRIADLCLGSGRVREAVAIWIGIALAYEAEGFLPQGNAMRMKAIRSAPAERRAWRGLIENHCLMGDLRSAISAHLTLATNLQNEARTQEADEELEAAFKLVPLIPPDS